MTEKLYDKDSFLMEFKATVLESFPKDNAFCIVLDKTAFFPEGGGQGSDIGFLDDARVFDVKIQNDIIYHYTDRCFSVGQAVNGTIDFERRFDFMQQHSAEHIVSGIAHSLYGCENVGFHLSEDIVTLDFDIPLSQEQILKIEKIANQKVYQNVKFNCYYPDDKTLEQLKYRSKKELEGAVRIVEIADTDMCACCAPHVKSAGQIGLIKLLDTEKLRGGIRIQLKAGSRALCDYNDKYKNIKEISNLLSAKQPECFEAVRSLNERLSSASQEITALKKRYIEKIISSSNGCQSLYFEDGLDMKELGILADGLYKAHGGIKAVFSRQTDAYAFAICGEDNELQKFFADFKAKLPVRGGGRNGMVQGNVCAEMQQIKLCF